MKKTPAKTAPAKKVVVKKAPATKSGASKAPAKRATATKAPAKKVVAKKAQSTKAPATKAPATKVGATKAPAKRVVAERPVAKRGLAPKDVAKTAPANRSVSKNPVVAKTPAKRVAEVAKAPVKQVAPKAVPVKKVSPGYRKDVAFLERQKQALLDERAVRLSQEQNQKQEAAALVEEMEPGDIQFDEESGEGGTLAVDREIHLELAAKQRLLVEEIDLALRKISLGTYGICERCEGLIPKARLSAIPEARICVPCSAGGLSRR